MPPGASRGDERPAPAERYVSPVVVLGLHALLLLDVVSHRRHLWLAQGMRARAELASAGVAVFAYLRTVLADPGFLRPESQPPPRRPRALRWLGAACSAPCAGLLALWRLAAPAGRQGAVPAAGSRAASAGDSRELQPIGRSALDEIVEEGSDPGEEVINLADLEGGAGGLAAAPPGGGGNGDRGAVPGSPCPRGRMKYKQGDQPNGPGGTRTAESSVRRVVLQSGQRLRYCKICHMHQPLRTKHCRDCDRCVRTHDHHCPWVGTCVGEGNRAHFYWFLAAQSVELVVFETECLLELFQQGPGLSAWMSTAPWLLVGLVVISLLTFMVLCLLAFHTYLALVNMTTWENMSWRNIGYLRSLPPEDGSPFSGSVRFNLGVYCCPHDWPCAPPEAAALKRTEDGWAIWEMGPARSPLEVDCGRCVGGPLKGQRCDPCACFRVQ